MILWWFGGYWFAGGNWQGSGLWWLSCSFRLKKILLQIFWVLKTRFSFEGRVKLTKSVLQ
jgi:hypothetical protein